MRRNKNFWVAALLAGLLLLIVFSCKKDKNQDQSYGLIPNVPVNFFIQPNTIDFMASGSSREFKDEGYRGVLIYRIDQYNFIAFEQTCTYDPQKETAHVVFNPNTQVTLIDSTCMSQFSIIDGSPFSGPATLPLRQYLTEFDGEYLHIYSNYK